MYFVVLSGLFFFHSGRHQGGSASAARNRRGLARHQRGKYFLGVGPLPFSLIWGVVRDVVPTVILLSTLDWNVRRSLYADLDSVL